MSITGIGADTEAIAGGDPGLDVGAVTENGNRGAPASTEGDGFTVASGSNVFTTTSSAEAGEVTLASTSSSPPADTYGTPHGAIEVSQETYDVELSGGGTTRHTVITVRRGDPAAAQSELDQATYGHRTLIEAGQWLHGGSRLNGATPQTVRFVYDHSSGEMSRQQWRSDGSRGILSDLSWQTSSGWIDVPRSVLDRVPADAAVRLTGDDATQWGLSRDLSGTPYWEVSYETAQGRRVQLVFSPTGELAQELRELGDGRTEVKFHPAWETMNVPTNGIAVPSGGTVITDAQGASVVNAAGDVRTNYARHPLNPDFFEPTGTVRHVYSGGQPTDLRLVTDAGSGSGALARVGADGELTAIAPAQRTDSGWVVQVNDQTAGLDVASLSTPEGEAMTLGQVDEGWTWSDTGHLVLDVAGLVPGWGEAADIANAVWYLGEGKYLDAGFSLLSMIPALGDLLGKGGRLASRIVPDVATARRLLTALDSVDVSAFLRRFADHPQLGPAIGKIDEAIQGWAQGLRRIVTRGDLAPELSSLSDEALDNLMRGLDAPGINRLAGEIGEATLGRLAAHLDGASIRRITDYFGQLDAGAGRGVLEAISLRGADEILAANRAVALEVMDGGHSLLRHGPDVPDNLLIQRLETGYAADGFPSATPASTQFESYQEWLDTRQTALDEFLTREGFTETTGAPGRYPPITVEHGRPLGGGHVGDRTTRARASVTYPDGGHRNVWVYPDHDQVSGLSRTQTAFEWDVTNGRWVAKQHFPSAYNWDAAAGAYTQPP